MVDNLVVFLFYEVELKPMVEEYCKVSTYLKIFYLQRNFSLDEIFSATYNLKLTEGENHLLF